MAKKNLESLAIEFGKRLKHLRSTCGLNQESFAEKAGFSGQSMVARYERGASDTISFDMLRKLSEFCAKNECSLEMLLTGLPSLSTATHNEIITELIARYFGKMMTVGYLGASEEKRKKFDEGKDLVIEGIKKYKEAIDMLAKFDVESLPPTKKQKPGFRTIHAEMMEPCIDWQKKYVPIVGRVAAGIGFEDLEAASCPPGWCDEYLEYADAPPCAIAVRVIGESMTPDYRGGDMLVVDTRSEVTSGVCCVLLDNLGEREALVKEVKKKGAKTLLISKNPAFPPREVPSSTIAATHKIIAHLPRSIPDEE